MELDIKIEPHWYKSIISRPSSIWFIIERDGQRVGLFNTYWKGKEYQWGIIVKSKFQRQGIAREAIKKILILTDKKKQDTYIECFYNNPAKKLYEELGYKETGESKKIRGREWIKMKREYK
jgi:RimJ/RimL family protein N-acetyltransferase